jgi:hypothetical protein
MRLLRAITCLLLATCCAGAMDAMICLHSVLSLVPLRGGALGRVPPSASDERRGLNLQLWQAAKLGSLLPLPLPSLHCVPSASDPAGSLLLAGAACARRSLRFGRERSHAEILPVCPSAYFYHQAGLVELLEPVVRQGAEVNAAFETTDKARRWVRPFPCAHSSRPMLVTLMLKYPCRCRTALHFAVQAGHIPVVDELVRLGSELNAVDEEENTVLHIAAALGNEGGVELLLIFARSLFIDVGGYVVNSPDPHDADRYGQSSRAARM